MNTHTSEQFTLRNDPANQLFGCEVGEYFQTLLSRLPWIGNGSTHPVQTLGLTSCYSGEGVSTVATQLAIAAASCGNHQVLLVDFNLIRPSVQRTFGVNLSPGLAEVLLDDGKLETGIQSSSVANLSLLTAGASDRDLAQAYYYHLASLPSLVESLKRDFDLVVFDMPAASQSSSAISLAGIFDRVLLVVESERVSWEVAQRSKEILTRASARLLGVVMNKRREHVPNWLYRTL